MYGVDDGEHQNRGFRESVHDWRFPPEATPKVERTRKTLLYPLEIFQVLIIERQQTSLFQPRPQRNLFQKSRQHRRAIGQ